MLAEEIEFTVSDFDAARLFLEALGFEVYTGYEKYRTTYCYEQCEIVLDEMPYGYFYEIEGPDVETIREVNTRLGLRWDAEVALSYTELFQQLRNIYHWEFDDLTFENFRELNFSLGKVGVIPADEIAAPDAG